MKRLYAPFGINIRRQKVAYCNNYIIPILDENKVKWEIDRNIMSIKFGGRVFPMKNIENGDAEEYAKSLVYEDGQATLDVFKR